MVRPDGGGPGRGGGPDGRPVPDGPDPDRTVHERPDHRQQGRPHGAALRLGSGGRRPPKARGLLDRPDSFLFTGIWYNSGHLGYALRATGVPGRLLPSRTTPEASPSGADRADWVGRDGTLVVLDGKATDADTYTRWFERIEPAGEFPIVRAGKAIRQVRIYRCVRQLAPFPFDYDGPSRAGKRMEPGAVIAGGKAGDWR